MHTRRKDTLALSYNSLDAGTSSVLGNGWSGTFQRHLVGAQTTYVSVIYGDGTALRYTFNFNPSGWLTPPSGASNSLQFHQANGTYTETQPDGVAYQYSGGNLQYVKSLNGVIPPKSLAA